MEEKHDAYAALRLLNFRKFITAKLLLTLSIQIMMLVVAWQLYKITKDPLSLGLIGLAEAIPALGVALYAGYIADHYNRKKIMLFCYGGLFISIILLVLFSKEQAFFIKAYGTLPIYAAIFISGIARGFHSPASFAFMTQLIPKNLSMNAATWSSTVWEVGTIGGPVIAGFLYFYLGAMWVYFIALVLLLAVILSIFAIPSQPLPTIQQKEPIVQSINSGLQFVLSNPIILSAISLDLFAVLFGGAIALLPVFAETILKVDAIGLGWLRAAPSIGALMMALVTAHLKPHKNAGKLLLMGVFMFGLATIGFALSTNFYLSFFMLFLTGAFDNISVVIRSTIMQLYTPEAMRGRVSAVNSMFIGSSNEIGAFESGVAARLLGTVPSVVFGGCMTLFIVIITYIKAPVLRSLDFSTARKQTE